MWSESVECAMYSVECKVRGVQSRVWCLEFTVKCEVWSGKYGVRSMGCEKGSESHE